MKATGIVRRIDTATSISTGHKTYSGTINMDEKMETSYETIAEKLKKQLGYKVGILSSVNLNHATPAAFYAHQASRNNYYEIGQELIASNFDYFAGGGLKKTTGSEGDCSLGCKDPGNCLIQSLLRKDSVLIAIQHVHIIFMKIFIKQEHITASFNGIRNSFLTLHSNCKSKHTGRICTDQSIESKLTAKQPLKKLWA